MTSLALPLETLARQAQEAAGRALSDNTLRAYDAQWRGFLAWCSDHALPALPAEPRTVALYLTSLSNRRAMATVSMAMASLSKAHESAGLPDPTKAPAARAVIAGLRRTKGRPPRRKAPVTLDILRAMLTHASPAERALVLVGFAGAFRRSELVSLRVEDLAFKPEGALVTLPRSKTDQLGQGRQVAIPFAREPGLCPVRALQSHLATVTGPRVFPLDPGTVARVVKRLASKAGLDPSSLSGHSLRAGLITAAAEAGTSDRVIMQTSGHRSVTMVARYVRSANAFREAVRVL